MGAGRYVQGVWLVQSVRHDEGATGFLLSGIDDSRTAEGADCDENTEADWKGLYSIYEGGASLHLRIIVMFLDHAS